MMDSFWEFTLSGVVVTWIPIAVAFVVHHVRIKAFIVKTTDAQDTTIASITQQQTNFIKALTATQTSEIRQLTAHQTAELEDKTDAV